MGWYGKLMLGSLGLFFGGPLGAILGAALGHHLVDKIDDQIEIGAGTRTHEYQTEQTQAAYFTCLFSILGKFAKVDGRVTPDEISVVETFINTLNVGKDEKAFARQVFTEAKKSQYSIDDFAAQFYRISGNQPTVLLSFTDMLFRVAAADGQLHPAEEDALNRIKHIFQISDTRFNELKSIYFNDTDRDYKMLNCTSSSSTEEIKQNYKKLVKEFHPDTIMAKGLPEEFIEFATKRFREIQEAYENIKKERKF